MVHVLALTQRLLLSPPTVCMPRRYHKTSTTQQQQQQHEHQFESLRESPQEGEGEGNTEGCEEEKDETDRVARGLMESTALEPAPPPVAAIAEAEAMAASTTEEDLPRDPSGISDKNESNLLDGDSTLGGMISPRPAEQDGGMQEEHANAVDEG